MLLMSNLSNVLGYYVSDGAGIVVGSILITPKVLMFNPNLSDQLVEESEPDKYQVHKI